MATLPRGSTAAAAGGAGAGDHEGRDIETSAERPHDNEDLTSTASSQTSQASGSDDQHEMQDAAGPARKERPASSVFGPTPEPQGEPSTTAAASATRRVIADVEADGPSDEDNFSLDREQNVAPQLGISEREHEPTHPEGDPRLSLQPPPPQPPGTDPSSSNAPSSSHLLSGADQDSRGDRAQASMSARSTTPGTDDGADLANPAGRLMGVPQSHSDGGESTQASPGIESPTASRRRTDTLSEGSDSAQPSSPAQSHEEAALAEFALPRWQPDAEVTYCAICQRQFSFFVRKHHCRKCGRVVCDNCSPHRIMIPYQYIVQPPGSEMPLPHSAPVDGMGTGYLDVNGLPGGERVRLCNPCVPDPNTAPPRSPSQATSATSRSAHARSRSSIGEAQTPLMQSNRYGAVFERGSGRDAFRYSSPRSRSITMESRASGASSRQRSSPLAYQTAAYQTPLDRLLSGAGSSSYATSYPDAHSSRGEPGLSSRRRARLASAQIAEEDECPVCHRELPSRALSNAEDLRALHIDSCIQAHSNYASAGQARPEERAPVGPRRTGMYIYPATEKDCIDDAECTICLEEFTVGVAMARLECLCRFHRACITAWFGKHPGRCPVHQHDGFGY